MVALRFLFSQMQEFLVDKTFFLLQQSVNQAGMSGYKKDVERNFKSLKVSLTPKDKETVPKLPQEQKEWQVWQGEHKGNGEEEKNWTEWDIHHCTTYIPKINIGKQ